MPEQTQITFTHKEIATALVKAQGIHEGIWAVFIKFGLRGMNVGANEDDLQPTAVVPVLAVGLQRAESLSNISVDAAVVNPAPGRARIVGTGKTENAKRKRLERVAR